MSSLSTSSAPQNERRQGPPLFGHGSSSVSQSSGGATQNSTTLFTSGVEPSSTGQSVSLPASSISDTTTVSTSLPLYHPAAPASSNTTPGTVAVSIAPYEEPNSSNGRDQYQVINAQPECSNYSLDELRVADYNQGIGGQRTDWAALCRRNQGNLKLLRGAGIEVCVGPVSCPCLGSATCNCNDSWFLPKALISRYSPFLRAACTRDFKERDENRIELPEDDPAAFALFVEWLYYGTYTIPGSSDLPHNTHNDVNMNTRCWTLGDKLLCTEFKNYAMSRLYTQCISCFASRVVTTHDVQHACENSAAGSKLRQLYFAYVVEHFANPLRLKERTEEWDGLLVHHEDLRLLLLQSFRMEPGGRQCVKSETEYMEQEDPLSNTFGKLKLEGSSDL